LGFGFRGYYPVSVLDFLGRVLPQSMDRLSDTGKLFMLLGEYMGTAYQGRYYARAQNQTFMLRDAYDEALQSVDVLAMPTCAPFAVAQPLEANPGIRSVFDAAFGYHLNTAPFNATEHPAITVPAGDVEGMPVGLMFVARHFDESVLIRLASAWEQIRGNTPTEVSA
jgi:amidase